MRSGRLRRQRSWAQRTVLASVGTLVFVISAVAAGLVAYLSAATDIGVRTTLEASLGDEAAVQVTLQGGDDRLAEDSAVTEHLGQLLAGVPYRLSAAMPPGRHPSTRDRTRSFVRRRCCSPTSPPASSTNRPRTRCSKRWRGSTASWG